MPDTSHGTSNGSEQHYTIADLAREFGVSARTLRHYEDQGLLSPARDGMNRIYSQSDRVRLSWILRGKRVGFSLADISEMLDLYDLDDGRATQRQVTIEKCEGRIETLKAQRDDIDRVIDEMTDFVNLLRDLQTWPDMDSWLDGRGSDLVMDPELASRSTPSPKNKQPD